MNCIFLKPSAVMLLFLLLFGSAGFNTVAAQNDELSKLKIELADAEACYLMTTSFVRKSFLKLKIGELKRKIRNLEPVQSSISSSTSSSLTIVANGVSFKMIRVEGGTFTMGATSEQGSGADDDEKPAHRVTLSSYYIGETEVTQALWEAVMGSNPSLVSKGTNRPVESVSWDDCKTFISKLNAITGKAFRLPSEAEWEFAARGGNKSKGYKYSGSNTLGNVAWYFDNCGETHDVKTKSPNELGLYDMSGNVSEWCQDWYGDYSSSSQTNPTGPSSGSLRVIRGGGWFDDATYCCVALRYYGAPTLAYYYLGFRLAL